MFFVRERIPGTKNPEEGGGLAGMVFKKAEWEAKKNYILVGGFNPFEKY